MFVCPKLIEVFIENSTIVYMSVHEWFQNTMGIAILISELYFKYAIYPMWNLSYLLIRLKFSSNAIVALET